MSIRPTLLLAGALVAVGCQGSLSEPGGFDRPHRPGSTTGPEEPGPTGGSCSIAPTPLRRLSHVEYANSLAALFPSVDLPDLQLPPDQRPHEFDNDVAALLPTSEIVERYVDVGEVVADRVVTDAPDAVMTCTPASDDERLGCGEQIVRTVGRRLFRRPLSDEQVTAYTRFFREPADGETFEDQVEMTLGFMLAAPEFLYRFEEPVRAIGPGQTAPLEPYSLASRLSFFLWAGPPDDALLDAAGSGDLSTEAGLRAQAERMLEDDRARDAFLHFHEQWLDFERLDRVTKADADGFDDALRESMRTESRMFVEHVLFDERGTIGDLLTSNRSFVDARLAELYGVAPPATDWSEVELPGRSGFLTQATFLASHGHPDKPSPVLRGVFLLERVMCAELGAPPPNAEAVGMAAAEEVTGPLTNRQLYGLMTEPAQCQACHSRINPAGFAFEHYDTMGRYRETEANGLEIDASGELDEYAFDDASDLAAQLAASEAVRRCVAQKWVRYAFAGGPMERATCFIDDLVADLDTTGGSIRDLQLAIVVHPSFATMVGPETAE